MKSTKPCFGDRAMFWSVSGTRDDLNNLTIAHCWKLSCAPGRVEAGRGDRYGWPHYQAAWSWQLPCELIYGCGAHMAADRDLYPSSKRRRRRFRAPWVDEQKRSSHHHIRFAKQSPRGKGNVGTSMMAAPTAWYQHG